MVCKGYKWTLQGEAYQKYVDFCRKWDYDSCSGGFSGEVSFFITPTSLGEIVECRGNQLRQDEDGNWVFPIALLEDI